MARKQYREAAKTAVIIANEEQINGKELFYSFISIKKFKLISKELKCSYFSSFRILFINCRKL